MAVQVTHHGGTQLRSLEKVLEDAQKTGKLNLSGRNLRDYPKSADKYDLLDTIEIDFSKNKLSELPCEICAYTPLQRLNCYNNVIKMVPEEIISLTSLSYLNLSRNQLSALPPQICDLFLEVLNLSNNKLVSLPQEIGKLRTLMLLDASCNELDNLPSEIGEMESLKELNIRRNHLVTLPEEISKLKLVKLDIACNKIQSIPPCFRAMHTLDVFEVDHNPLTNPPAQVCTRGRVHIFKYLATEAIRADKRRGMIEQIEWGSSTRAPYNTKDELSLFNNKMRDLRKGIKTADSGYLEGDKRWSSSEASTEDDEARCLAERAAKQKERRQQPRYTPTDPSSTSIMSSRNFQQAENHIDFIDAGEEEEDEEDAVTPTQSPAHTPTMGGVEPDAFTKELERQKAMYEEKKRQAREERLRMEVEEEQRKKNGRHAPSSHAPPSHAPPPPPPSQPPSERNGVHSKEGTGVRRLSGDSRPQRPVGIVSANSVANRLHTANGSTGANTNGTRRAVSASTSSASNIGRPRSLYIDKKIPRRATVGGSADDSSVGDRTAGGDRYSNTKNSIPVPNGRIAGRVPDPGGAPPVVGGQQVSPERYKAQVNRRAEIEEKQRIKQAQKDALHTYYKVQTRTSPSPSPTNKRDENSSNNAKNSPSSNSGSAFGSIKPRSAFSIGGGKTTGEGLQSNFTAKRERTKWAEELERIEQLRKSIESRLKVSLSEDLAEALMDGVTLCYLANNLKPHAISSIHLPSHAVPKLSQAKCRRNVENFLKVCEAIGVPGEKLCTPSDILEGKGLPKLATTVRALLQTSAILTKQWAV